MFHDFPILSDFNYMYVVNNTSHYRLISLSKSLETPQNSSQGRLWRPCMQSMCGKSRGWTWGRPAGSGARSARRAPPGPGDLSRWGSPAPGGQSRPPAAPRRRRWPSRALGSASAQTVYWQSPSPHSRHWPPPRLCRLQHLQSWVSCISHCSWLSLCLGCVLSKQTNCLLFLQIFLIIQHYCHRPGELVRNHIELCRCYFIKTQPVWSDVRMLILLKFVCAAGMFFRSFGR